MAVTSFAYVWASSSSSEACGRDGMDRADRVITASSTACIPLSRRWKFDSAKRTCEALFFERALLFLMGLSSYYGLFANNTRLLVFRDSIMSTEP